ncbi:uncharacterized protein LOC126380636 [Pectinophora gossypiella]|uniref:uncharacterized protein LOC126380636 n=1 Tax=Pectinophora gossypiella TaxID=13191 RepID=UPI00214E0BF2|nr:uncharacterized protein LOC126380636 [Pectinophora gossypiella]
MAATLLKFSLSPARVLLASSAVFIMLSVGLVEGRQCFWCGPLAEQVHRSRRAPPCAGGVRHVTACDPGYSYCAIVATSPPYVESRYCVKIYQDECYPLYCNSTRTWKMTCPCRGDLCNGGNTEREKEAFDVLPRLVAKTSRIQRRNASPPTMMKQKNAKMIDPNNEEVPDNSLQRDAVTTSKDNVRTASDIDVTVNYTSSEESGTDINKTMEMVTNSTTSHNSATSIDYVSSRDDIQTSTNMIEIDLNKWYETAGKDSDEIDDDGITILSEHPSHKHSQDKSNHDILKHDDSAIIHEANHKKERPIVHVDPDTKEVKWTPAQTMVTTEIPNIMTSESGSPASLEEGISLKENHLQPSMPSPIEAFQQDESAVGKATEATADKIVETSVDKIAEVPVEKIAETPVNKIAELHVDKIAESPLEKVSESPVKTVAEDNQNKINPTKEPTEQSTIKQTSATPSVVSKNATVPGQSAHTPKQINKNYATAISANVITIVHCFIFNSFV